MNAITTMWKDAHATFKAAFDTPINRRKQDDEYAQDARKRIDAFNEIFKDSIPKSTPTDDEGNIILIDMETGQFVGIHKNTGGMAFRTTDFQHAYLFKTIEAAEEVKFETHGDFEMRRISIIATPI